MGNRQEGIYSYVVLPKDNGDSDDERAAEALSAYLKSRSRGSVKVYNSENARNEGPVMKILLNVDPSFKYDFSVKNSHGRILLSAKTYQNMLWLEYQLLSRLGRNNLNIETSDLPPAVLSMNDTTGNFSFSYRNVYMPMNLDSDMTGVLGLCDINSWGLWGHNMKRVVTDPQDEDIYAKVGGKLHREQFCFSSERLYESFVSYVGENFGFGEKQAYNFSVFPNDNSTVCQCPKCMRLGNRENDAAPAVTRMVERLAARFPGHNFYTSYYRTTLGIPNFKLSDNVGVILSAIDLPRAVNLKGRSEYSFFRTIIDTWKLRCDKIIVWDYISNFDDYLSPFPVLRIMKERMSAYKELNISGLFLNGSGYDYSFMQEMKTTVLAALMMNPDINMDGMVRAYLMKAMPVNARLVYDFYVDMEKRLEERGRPLPLYGGMSEMRSAFLDKEAFIKFYNGLVLNEVCLDKEKALVRRLKHDLAYTLLEIIRNVDGIFPHLDKEGEPMPYVKEALYNLKEKPEPNDLPYLLCNNSVSMKSLSYLSESGHLISDYHRECMRWLEAEKWKENLIFMSPVDIIEKGEDIKREKTLSDGIEGLSNNYHWGWYISRQKELRLCLPVDRIKEGRHVSISFLNLHKHRLSPPKVVQIVIDGKAAGLLDEYVPIIKNDGMIHVFKGEIDFSLCKEKAEIRLIPSGITRDFAFDEIIITK